MKTIFIMILFFEITNIYLYSQTNQIQKHIIPDSILRQFNIPNQGYAIIEFCTLGECAKCNLAAESQYQCLRDSLGIRMQLIASVFCNRKKEVDYFASTNNSYDSYKKTIEGWYNVFGIDYFTRIMVVRWDGDVQCTIDVGEFLKANFCKKILMSLKK